MKHTIFKRLTALFACCAVATGCAFAISATRTITVEYSNIKLVVDGIEITPTDANGSTVEPFIYNGTTYLPVRAVGNAIGKQVNWDGGSKTVYIGEMPNARNWLMTVCPPYESRAFSTEPASFKMDGQTYTHGFYCDYYGDNYGLFNLNGQYSTLSCDIGRLDGHATGSERYIEIYLDGDLSQVIEIPAESMVKHFDIPLNNALQMKITVDCYLGVANAELK